MMMGYIDKVKCALRDQHGAIPSGGTEHSPTFINVPDGEYVCEIDGRKDYVKITNMMIGCCNFEEEEQ